MQPAIGQLRLVCLLLILGGQQSVVSPTVGIQCRAGDYVHNISDRICKSCWEDCGQGQFCRRVGGCTDCPKGEYDGDGDPTHPCEACPDGKTSPEAAHGAGACDDEPASWGASPCI